jgi:hypothetical protein
VLFVVVYVIKKRFFAGGFGCYFCGYSSFGVAPVLLNASNVVFILFWLALSMSVVVTLFF